MSRSSLPFPPPEEGLRLHLHLCDGDPVASAQICRAYVAPLCDWLAGPFARVDPHVRETAVHEAVMHYLQSPQAYDPRRADLAAYLRMAARRDLENLLAQERRHHRRRIPWSDVELGEEHRNIPGRAEEPSHRLEQQEEAAAWRASLDAFRAGLTPAEECVLHLLLAGERSTRAFALALGLQGLSADGEAREVKRVKDRLKKRLERERPRHG
jgi:hypothetical protein